MSAAASSDRRGQGGFTLLELTVAIGILGVVLGLMYQVIQGTIEGRNMVYEELRKPKVANAILGQIFKDFRYIYWGGLVGDAGFRGRPRRLSGMDADQVAFVTARRTRTVGAEDDGNHSQDDRESYLTETGYACRLNDDNPEWLELWRREDYFVDSKPTEGGYYTLVYDKIRNFRIRYFPTPEEHFEDKEGLEEWDSAQKKGIPYAILLKIDFDIHKAQDGSLEEKEEIDPIHRIILLRGGYNEPWSGGEAPGAPATPSAPGR
jgi:prepilin-type N-terminal cleavage/methylation domain-containing protein